MSTRTRPAAKMLQNNGRALWITSAHRERRLGRVVDLVERRGIDHQIFLLSTPHMGEAERDFVDEAFRTNWIAPLGPNGGCLRKRACRDGWHKTRGGS